MSLDFSQDYEAPIVTTSLTPLDDGEVSLRPKTLADYTGQEKAKGNLSVYIEAARRRRGIARPCAAVRSSGAWQNDARGRHRQRDGRQHPRDLRAGYRKGGRPCGAADESRAGGYSVYRRDPPPEPRGGGDPVPGDGGLCAIDIIIGKGPSANSIRLDLPKFTLIGATTRAGQLSSPLRDRFGVQLRLELYTQGRACDASSRASAALLGIDIAPERRGGDRRPVARDAAHRQPPAAARARFCGGLQ